jgi:c-di-GMP-binding flagellar brake protein YcgR
MAEVQRGEQGSVWSRFLRDRESIWRVFREFRDRDDPVTLRFESVDTVYTAHVRDVDHRRVTLDSVQPRSGEVLMNAGRSFALMGRSDGAYVYAPGIRSAGSTPAEQGNLFVVDLPAELLWQQRRRGPRFPVPAALRAGRARITLVHQGRNLAGAVEDISSHGCRATFDAAARHDLHCNGHFDDAHLEIAGLLSIRLRLAVRHRTVDSATGDVTCGLEFTRTAADSQARLEQFLRTLARRAASS